MGLIADIYRNSLNTDCSNGGIFSKGDRVTIVDADGPDKPRDDAPAVELIARELFGITYVHAQPVESNQAMAGGTFICTTDSRFNQAVSKLAGHKLHYPVALHDRVER